MNVKYAYSTCQELYHGEFDSREEAVQDCGESCWTGVIVRANYTDFIIDAGHIIEQAQEMAWDKAGEHADDYLAYVTKEQENGVNSELPSLLYDLFKKHGVELSPSFFTVKDVLHHEI